MLAASSTGIATLFGHGAARTVGAGKSFSAITTAISLTWGSEEDMRLAPTHGRLLPGRRSQVNRRLN